MNLLTMAIGFAELSDDEIAQRDGVIFKCETCSDISADVYHSVGTDALHTKGEKLVAMMPFCNKIVVN